MAWTIFARSDATAAFDLFSVLSVFRVGSVFHDLPFSVSTSFLPLDQLLIFAPIRVPNAVRSAPWPCDGSFHDGFRFGSPLFDCLV